VTARAGTEVQAVVSDAGGSVLQLLARLQVHAGPGTVSGTVTATPQGGPG
jgi:hypothetical protein